MYRTDFWTLWENARVGCFERIASKHIYYLGWNRSPAQAGCMKQVFQPGALGRPKGIGWRGRWEGGLGWGIHVNPWLIHVNVWQKPLQYCKVISLQLIIINGKKKEYWSGLPHTPPGDLPNPGIKPRSPALQADSWPSEPPGKPRLSDVSFENIFSHSVRCLFLLLMVSFDVQKLFMFKSTELGFLLSN